MNGAESPVGIGVRRQSPRPSFVPNRAEPLQYRDGPRSAPNAPDRPRSSAGSPTGAARADGKSPPPARQETPARALLETPTATNRPENSGLRWRPYRVRAPRRLDRCRNQTSAPAPIRRSVHAVPISPQKPLTDHPHQRRRPRLRGPTKTPPSLAP